MQVIISHINLDFDGLASIIAAGKIYPKAKKVLPERLSLSVQKFLALYKDSIPLFTPQQIDWDRVEESIIVDTSNLDRVGSFKDYIKQSKKIIYDHHENYVNIPGTIFSKIESIGATVTLLVEEIKSKNIPISSFEATIMALGIYTDTGSFSYSSTTSRDLQAAAYLLEKGANLAIVSRFSEGSLLGEQQNLFNKLMINSSEYNIKGIDILIAWHKQKDYQGGLSLLASKMLEITGVDVLFLVVDMAKKVYVIGRSNTDLLDVHSIVKEFGGGGHAKAASATIKEGNYLEIMNQLKNLLVQALKPSILAKDIMSSPVKTIYPDTKIKEAAKIMLRYGHTGLPVVSGQELVGIISRRDVDKAVHHGLGHAPVKGFMSKNLITISPESSLEEIQDTMISKDVGRLPVLEKGKIVGIVSRTDVLNHLHGENIKGEQYSALLPTPIEKNIKSLLEKNISDSLLNILKYIGAKADKKGCSIYLVGGIVRDLLLEYPSEDIDIVIEGDAIQFAQELSSELGGMITSHKKYGTAIWKLANGQKIDFATARREYYDYPAAMPTVERSSLKEDLFRRDFTINAMAIQLNSKKYGYLIDYFHGYQDLQQSKIRVLYNLSFVEDPTRILRAVRFEQRFGFSMDNQTLELAKSSVELIGPVSNSRVASELKSLFTETNPLNSIRRLDFIGVWDYLIEPDKINKNKMQLLIRLSNYARSVNKNISWMGYMAALLYNKNNEDWINLLKNYALNKQDKKFVLQLKYCFNNWDDISQEKVSLGFLHSILKNVFDDVLIFILATRDFKNEILLFDYILKRKKISVPVTGDDLIKMGIKPGPIYNEILTKLEEALLGEEYHDKQSAKIWIENYLRTRKE